MFVPDAASLALGSWHAIGPGWNYREEMPEPLRLLDLQVDSTRQPRAAAMARLAARDFADGKGMTPEEAMPVYLRDTVSWKKSNHRD